MSLKINVNNLTRFKIDSKSNWFVKNSFNYKKHIYEDIFIRKYVSSFFVKWSKFFDYKVLGSIYLFRTFGKTYINVYFFYPCFRQKLVTIKKKIKLKHDVFFKVALVKPINKYKKHLTILLFFYQLEKILNTQVLFKFKNICTGLLSSKLTTPLMLKLNNHLTSKLLHFKYQFKEEIYFNTILFILNLFKFKIPDGTLFANYISSVLPLIQKHTQFLTYIKNVLQIVQKIFRFSGAKILLSGKLNGFSRSQSKQIQVGCVPLQSMNMPYVTGHSHSFTSAGKIGVKIWIC